MIPPIKTNRLVGSRITEELISETWHRIETKGNIIYNSDALRWLESDAMKGRWCIPASGIKHGLYFELEEDKVHFWMLWS